jgi:hypothetical protein
VKRYGDVAVLTYNLQNYARQAHGSERPMNRWNSSRFFAASTAGGGRSTYTGLSQNRISAHLGRSDTRAPGLPAAEHEADEEAHGRELVDVTHLCLECKAAEANTTTESKAGFDSRIVDVTGTRRVNR